MHRSSALALTVAAAAALSPLAVAQGWVDRTPTNPLQSPTPRAFAAMTWDGAHGYALLFGGQPGPVGTPDETWTWDGSAWTRRLTINQPFGSWSGEFAPYSAMAFHPPGNQVVLMAAGSTWLWTGSDWMLHPGALPSTGSLSGAGNVAMAHDPVRNQTVLFVGTRWQASQSSQSVSQTFLWNGNGWTMLQPATSPWPNTKPSLAFDPAAGKLVLATTGATGAAFWEWNGTNWHQRLIAGAPAANGALASDPSQQRLVMLDGVLDSQPHHTWTLANGALQQLSTPVEPARRVGAAMTFDPIRQRTLLFGGALVWNVTPSGSTIVTAGDTWEFQLGAGASYTPYGAGCTGSRGVPSLAASGTSLPRAGQTFQARVTNLPFTAPTFLFLGLSNTSYGGIPLPLDLGFLGAPGCNLLASGDDLALVTNVLGTGLWQWQVPNALGVSFYNQAVVFDPTANPLGITTSNGAHGVIGW